MLFLLSNEEGWRIISRQILNKLNTICMPICIFVIGYKCEDSKNPDLFKLLLPYVVYFSSVRQYHLHGFSDYTRHLVKKNCITCLINERCQRALLPIPVLSAALCISSKIMMFSVICRYIYFCVLTFLGSLNCIRA